MKNSKPNKNEKKKKHNFIFFSGLQASEKKGERDRMTCRKGTKAGNQTWAIVERTQPQFMGRVLYQGGYWGVPLCRNLTELIHCFFF